MRIDNEIIVKKQGKLKFRRIRLVSPYSVKVEESALYHTEPNGYGMLFMCYEVMAIVGIFLFLN